MTLILWILRILVVLLVIRFVLRFIASVTAGAKQAPPRRKPQERIGGTLVRDPHCGTYIPQSAALTSGRGDQAVFFCSATCRDAWAAAHRN
jgi:hypothetical protein